MATWARPTTTPGPGAVRASLLVGLGAALVAVAVLTTAVRDPAGSTTTELQRMQDAVALGCAGSGDDLATGTGFAVDGTVVAVGATAGPGPAWLTLRAQEWFRGPPLEQVEVAVDDRTVRHLAGQGVDLEVGARLLVSGHGWRAGEDPLTAAGCGRTRPWEADAAQDWRAALPAPSAVAPAGPAATYPDVGFVLPATDPPDLVGVLVLDDGCLYLQDGLSRWVPLLPAGRTSWRAGPQQLVVDGLATDVGHAMRVDGAAARAGSRAAGVPAACDPASPRFVVSRTPPGTAAGVVPLPQDHPVVATVAAAAGEAGLPVVAGRATLTTDAYGSSAWRFVLSTDAGAAVLVHVETVSVLAWPQAFATGDARLRWSLDPVHAPALPAVPPGAELVVLDREDGVTQVLVRSPGRVVASASADLDELAAVGGGVPELADLARAVALSPGDAGS